ncbi:hypothetical protein DUK53_17185 [Listeria sp. SHR_NRA_18]|nr:hypothetical protein DUK53_17185 [Listeria sp. SHR_NRA_18]
MKFTMTKRTTRTFTPEFKKQIIQLHAAGKSRKDILIDYELAPSVFDRWRREYNKSGSFLTNDNKTAEQKEIEALRKQLAQKELEVDILKQAALIFGRKSK